VISAALAWLAGTRAGRTLAVVLIAAAVAAATYAYVDSRAFHRGQADVQAKWDKAVTNARQQAAAHTAAQTDAGAKVAATATQASTKAHAAVLKTDTETKEVIRYVYRDRPTTDPVQPGSLVHPLDPRVQDRIQLGVDQARAATR
jgi:hypothetical protein